MRYYHLALYATSNQIKETTTIKYGYENTLCAVNDYMFKHLQNGVFFVMCSEDGNTILAVFSYDEKNGTFRDAYANIMGMLGEAFGVNRTKTEPEEITMYQMLDYINEAKRRENVYLHSRFLESMNLQICNFYNNNPQMFHYDFDEKIVPEDKKYASEIYDQAFITELKNIEEHTNETDYKTNIVHYVISSRSVESASDMTEILMQRLYKSKRISGRRMEIISQIGPGIYHELNHLEEIIENNYGGVIVFDLTEKFGCDSVDYTMTSKYILNLLKRYRNKCLFVFTYRIDNPGFSYQILPHIKKYVIPVMFREGRGDRKAAVKYMKTLIKASEYAEYAGQTAEFMKLFPGNDFSQTDVLMAYEQFESWCLNKNVLHAYDYDLSKGFMLDRDVEEESSYDRLNKLVGLDIVKKQIDSIIATDIVEKERRKRKGNDYQTGSMHMIFGGNPGSAKTTVAKLFAGIAKEKGILKSGAFVERGGMDLDGLGCVTAIREAFAKAMGGVLFIDEAYAMMSDTAVTVLIQEMENRRDDVIVILAGYNDRMKAFMKINEGLKSRIPYWIDFPDYSADELTDIFKLMIMERGFSTTDDAEKEAQYIFEKVRNTDNFGNGRYVRNMIDRAVQNQAVRLLSTGKKVEDIHKGELFRITKNDISMLEERLKKERVIGTANKELDEMIGLTSVKEIIHKAVAYYKLNKLCIDKGIAREKVSFHMVFTGNPGTAKTTVARLFAEVLKDEQVLSTGTFVEVGRADLVGTATGMTAPLVKRKLKEAQGGVIFVDEAYSLCDAYENGFGDEAINTIVQEMENYRDNVIVIFAGYPDKMKHFLDRNPGLMSRIAFHVEFEDYSIDELCAISDLLLERKNLKITKPARNKLRMLYDQAKGSEDFGNGRFVRKTIEEAEMNLAERLVHLSESEITEELLTVLELEDIPDLSSTQKQKVNRIGFCA